MFIFCWSDREATTESLDGGKAGPPKWIKSEGEKELMGWLITRILDPLWSYCYGQPNPIFLGAWIDSHAKLITVPMSARKLLKFLDGSTNQKREEKIFLSPLRKAMWQGVVLNSLGKEFHSCVATSEACHPEEVEEWHLPLLWPKMAGWDVWKYMEKGNLSNSLDPNCEEP